MSRFQQGTFDGFCGLYCATYLVSTCKKAAADAFFFELLKSVERRGWLTSARIASTNRNDIGFCSAMVEEAVNDIQSNLRFGLSAIAFKRQGFQRSYYRGDAGAAFRDGCGLIISIERGCHWVATKSFSKTGDYKTYDPMKGRHSTSSRIYWDDGLMIGPANVIEAL